MSWLISMWFTALVKNCHLEANWFLEWYTVLKIQWLCQLGDRYVKLGYPSMGCSISSKPVINIWSSFFHNYRSHRSGINGRKWEWHLFLIITPNKTLMIFTSHFFNSKVCWLKDLSTQRGNISTWRNNNGYTELKTEISTIHFRCLIYMG